MLVLHYAQDSNTRLDWAKITLVDDNHGFGCVITTQAQE